MLERDLVLYNPQNIGEPLLIEFKDNVFVGNEDQIVCDITLEQAYKMLEHSYGEYFEDNIYIPSDVERYLNELKEDKAREKAMWEQIGATEIAAQEMIKNRKGKK